MGLFNFLFGKKNTDSTDYALSESSQSVVENANAFAGFCRKIDRDESYHSPIYYIVKTDSTGDVGVFAVHVSDNNYMEVAYYYAKNGNVHFVEVTQKRMAEIYGLTPTELSVLQDAERFADSLLAEISFFDDFLLSGISFATFFLGRTSRAISCKRSSSGFEITRLLGYVPEYEKDIILSEIKISLISSYSDVMIETDIDMKTPVSFSVKF